MPSESVASFLDLAREKNILQAGDVDALFQQPDVPQQNLAALCEFLQMRGVLTQYQSDVIRAGKGYELNFAGYPILDELGPCPGGTAYKGIHPALRTPVVIRRLRSEWFAPLDNASAYLQRAQDAAPTVHPNLAHLLDAGVHRDEAFVVLEPFDSADLESLIGDIGPMPASLAAEFIKQAALALQTAHLSGLVHGDIRPANLRAGPLITSTRVRIDGSPRYRPASTATVKLFELGLVPIRPAVAGDPYLAPKSKAPSAEADIFALGASLTFLLTAKPPTTPETLSALRPDAPPALLNLVSKMMAVDPGARPTASEVLVELSELDRLPTVDRKSRAPSALGGGELEHLEVNSVIEGTGIDMAEAAEVDLASVAEDSLPVVGDWPAHTPEEWAPHDEPSSTPSLPRVVPKPAINKAKVLIWIAAFFVLNFLAAAIWASIYFGVFDSTPEPEPKAAPPSKPAKKSKSPT